ncbi:hypothetical protein PR048_033030 [Dryococelus australis]|uniref:Secreted protein n=1 Tax=Dryococelus australis TaxID=614101 RepID=A0ABQ9G816_9NEOP|nr:hypothetical protein PR048_033030 [Dryococelus australis]
METLLCCGWCAVVVYVDTLLCSWWCARLVYVETLLCYWWCARLVYVETSALSGTNVALAVELLLDRIMKRMEAAVDRAMLPEHRGGAHIAGDNPPADHVRSSCVC